MLLDGGPCTDRTYDQFIKRSPIDRSFSPYRTISYAYPTVPQFSDLPRDKALNSQISLSSNGTLAALLILAIEFR
jgi:hypothetical protein